MSDLTIDEIDEALKRELRTRATFNGQSMEEEARCALVAFMAVEAKRETAGDVLRRLRAEAGGGADFEPLDRSEWKDRPVDFGL